MSEKCRTRTFVSVPGGGEVEVGETIEVEVNVR